MNTTMIMDIEFVPIPGLEGRYSASRCGKIFSVLSRKILSLYVDGRGYEVCSISTHEKYITKVSVHSLIALTFLGIRPEDYEVDHINRVRSDNRLENLRYATISDNNHNKGRQCSLNPNASRFKGVFKAKHRATAMKPWTACLRFNKKRIYLKYFRTEEEAAMAYDTAVIGLRGSGACTNKSLGYFA